jgi:SNF2 family DNA or RNA helicase
MISLIDPTIAFIENSKLVSTEIITQAQFLLNHYDHVILSQGKEKITVQISHAQKSFVVDIIAGDDEMLSSRINGSHSEWNVYNYAALLLIREEVKEEKLTEGIKYTRAGMQNRVYGERLEKAKKADYKIKLATNLYGEHTLINEKGKEFKVTLRDFDKKTGYINNIDWQTNKLGTTKHIMYLFNYLDDHPSKLKRLKKTYPFIEVYTDPLNDYKISWYYPEPLQEEEQELISRYFGTGNYIEDARITSFFTFINKAREYDRIKIRKEVLDKIESYFEQLELAALQEQTTLDFSAIKAPLYPYQVDGVKFSVFKKGVIIADEMGLGKTLQAITTAILKKDIFDFKRTLVICPASVKSQWRDEVLKFSDEAAAVIEGMPADRNALYRDDPAFFHIINYETVLRDLAAINRANYDFVILDEAQKIKNYETKTANAVKAIHKKHAMVITGTPIENKLLDLYSIMQFVDSKLLSPQWELSYQHCIFDSNHKNKIHGYYNLKQLKSRLKPVLLRRKKQEVFKQLPSVIQKNIYVALSDEQAYMHANFGKGIATILGKKFKTPYDWQRLMLLLNSMRMVCDSTYLIDKETSDSPKLIELKDILIERLEIKETKRKVIIFSEWVTMLHIIGDMLKKEGITYTMLTGKVPVKKRADLIKEFEQNPECSVFLSSESGGAGLNLQVADTVINFELPWNPAKKNQRIGRIDRIGQLKQKLHVFNLLSHDSIEMKIATGLLLKQNLFDGILNNDATIDEVDFSEKGKSQFIKRLEEAFSEEGFVNRDVIEDLSQDTEQEQEEELFENQYQPISNTTPPKEGVQQTNKKESTTDFKQMEEVMTKGMDFLAGIYKMSTGNELNSNGKPKVNINKETGEVSIVFKLETM